MNNAISGTDVALIEREFEDAIRDMNDDVRALNNVLKKMIDNFSELDDFWNTKSSADILERFHDVSNSVISSQKKIDYYCGVISSDVLDGENLDYTPYVKEDNNE